MREGDPFSFGSAHPTRHGSFISARGAVFENVGTWQRAHHFPRAAEDVHSAVARECRTVRTAVGIFDATTLGKIEVIGPDSGEFLDRIYTGNFARLFRDVWG